MPHTTPNDERRREDRYTVTSAHSIHVLIHRKVEERVEAVKGKLVDLSQSGAKLLVSSCLQFSEVVNLQMTVQTLGLNIDAGSQVCWIRPAADDQWLVGCSFTPKISEDALGQLAGAGIVERRSHPRHPVEMLATAHWESDMEPFPVVLRDYSANGFCMSSIRPGKVGQGVSIDLNTMGESQRDITGKVRWQIQWKGEYLIGCMMNDREDFERFRDLGGFSADGDRNIWSAVTDRVPEKYRRYALPTVSWIFVFASSMLLGLSVPLFWHLTSENAQAGATRITALSLAQRRAAADAPPVSEPTVPKPQVLEQRVVEQPSSGAVKTPEEQSVHRDTPDTQLQSTNDDVVHSATRASAEDLAKPAIVPATSKSNAAAAPTLELEDAKEHVQAFIQAIVGDNSNVTPSGDQPDPATTVSSTGHQDPPVSRRSPASPGQAHDQDPMSSLRHYMLPNGPGDNTAQINQDVGKAQRIAQAPPSHHTEATGQNHRAREAWLRGERSYRTGQFPEASQAFRDAVRHDPQNALYAYLLAMSLHEMGQFDEANEVLTRAIEMEQSRPIENWGTALSRYQGRPRLWIEQQRSAARQHLSP